MNSVTSTANKDLAEKHIAWQRQLNKLRWLALTTVFSILILLPFLHLYQTYLAAHAYEILSPNEKIIFNVTQSLTSPFTASPESDLDNFKGTTWSGTLFGMQLSDPLAVLTNISASFTFNTSFMMTALIPVLLTLTLGRFFCGWICPATFIYELNDNLGTWLHNSLLQNSLLQKIGLPIGQLRFNQRLKYLILAICIIVTAIAGTTLVSNVYPPAVIGREIYYLIVVGGFGIGATFILITMLFDLFIARRGFCRYLCPGGALYSLLGRYRILRIKRDVTHCTDCVRCNAACQFGLDPMQDNFGQECNNCTACITTCPTDALSFTINVKDVQFQGAGHLGHQHQKQQGGRLP